MVKEDEGESRKCKIIWILRKKQEIDMWLFPMICLVSDPLCCLWGTSLKMICVFYPHSWVVDIWIYFKVVKVIFKCVIIGVEYTWDGQIRFKERLFANILYRTTLHNKSEDISAELCSVWIHCELFYIRGWPYMLLFGGLRFKCQSWVEI